jgi:alanine racemase
MQWTRGRPTVAEVSLGALRNNLREAQRLVGPGVRVVAVVTADGYGHGAVASARSSTRRGHAWHVERRRGGRRRAGVTALIVVLGASSGRGGRRRGARPAAACGARTVRALVAARGGDARST